MKTNSIIKGQNSSYQIQVVANHQQLRIQNTKNVLVGTAAPKNLKFIIADYEFEATAQIFQQALGLPRLKELEEKSEDLAFIHYLSPQGKILEIEFVIQGLKTSITAVELETLEGMLKDNLSFRVIWEDEEDADFAYTLSRVPFKTIIRMLESDGSAHVKIINVTLTPPPPRLK